MTIPILSNIDIDNISNDYKLNIACLTQQHIENAKHIKGKHYIINLNREGMMGHWTALYIVGNKGYYMDSYGVQPSQYILNFMKRNGLELTKWNNNDIQDFYDISCGFYCLAFIMFMRKSKTKKMDAFTSLFKNDTRENTKILQNLFKLLF
jgi:hypothetical protein